MIQSGFLTDLYELLMVQAYLQSGLVGTAVFEFFCRNLPPNRNFLLAVGLETVLDFLQEIHFEQEGLEWLEKTGRFSSETLEYLRGFRFQGDVYAMDEGTPFFAQEPVVQVVAPLPQAQLIESRLINLLHYQILVASKAVRCRLVAKEKRLVEFGLRRAHGGEAALLAARASYAAGFDATSNVLAGRLYGIPISGTMAHSFILAHDREEDAFMAFARANRSEVVFLLDTYDTEKAAQSLAKIGPLLTREGIRIRGVRLDSGNLGEHARRVREILDSAGFHHVEIFASGNLDEHRVGELVAQSAPIDGFGVGTAMDTSSDAPYLDCAYKLQEYEGKPRRKRSEGKETWAGRKQVYRVWGRDGVASKDILALAGERVEGEPLLRPVMKDGKRLYAARPLDEIRRNVLEQLDRLPEGLRELTSSPIPYRVEISPGLASLQTHL
ncbi:nicotinate phosphoribosyltransferase [Candidatus Methylacidithermus pantelleriae]|uniref:Nicotinate phosphoribosyltransferase n=1 Tax=Candidatus Methylacidithermus pantelleriae TaxID=2744239 RepID=A0A8J2FP94_9BACT|nr:nicotinate phosphoribosyltransferase [Candidatus Methylacidithermus pantelleriae]CAF0696349.1 Nicotinate phosphoribosyltransferase pncB2 [Candidatus Methylacidithermus pantelleriae]